MGWFTRPLAESRRRYRAAGALASPSRITGLVGGRRGPVGGSGRLQVLARAGCQRRRDPAEGFRRGS